MQLTPGIPLTGLESPIGIKNMSKEACHLLAPMCFCSSLLSLHCKQWEMFKRKCTFQHRNTTSLWNLLCFERYKDILTLALVREGVSAWKSELAAHQEANKQNDIHAVWRASFQVSTNTCIFLQADKGCV